MLRMLDVAALPRARLRRLPAAWWVFGLALAWLGVLAGLRPLALPDEGRYVGVALEMLRSGHWVTPTLDGLPFLHKPPLFYWITAAAMGLFGPVEWAARCAPLLGASATVAILYATLREWQGERTARLAVLVLATQPLFFGGAQYANMDMLVAACISAAILFGARAALRFEAGRDRRGDLAGAYIAMGLGVLAKGLIGIVIPVLVMGVWLGWVRRGRTLRALLWLPGLAIGAVIVLPWFVMAQAQTPDFLHYFFVVQHFKRFAGSGFNNVRPFWFYVPVLFAGTLPWSLWWFAGLRGRWAARAPRARRPALASLMLVWLGIVLLFFSVPASKLVGYVLPALVPLAVLVTLAAEPLLAGPGRARGLWRASVAVSALICVAVTIGYAVERPRSSQALAQALAAQRGAAAGGLAFIEGYRYDVPFYLRDTGPVMVVSDWDPAEVRRQDNWRRELADAGDFAPDRAAARLLDDAAFRAAVCAGRVRWVMGGLDSVRRYPFLGTAPRLATEGDAALWRIDAPGPAVSAALGCTLAAPSPAPATPPVR